jgi:hypothetical protein
MRPVYCPIIIKKEVPVIIKDSSDMDKWIAYKKEEDSKDLSIFLGILGIFITFVFCSFILHCCEEYKRNKNKKDHEFKRHPELDKDHW